MFYGLREHVAFREEMGYTFLDDGKRVFRMNCVIFENLKKGVASDEENALAAGFKEIFVVYPTIHGALESFLGKEL